MDALTMPAKTSSFQAWTLMVILQDGGAGDGMASDDIVPDAAELTDDHAQLGSDQENADGYQGEDFVVHFCSPFVG